MQNSSSNLCLEDDKTCQEQTGIINGAVGSQQKRVEALASVVIHEQHRFLMTPVVSSSALPAVNACPIIWQLPGMSNTAKNVEVKW